MDRVLTLTLSGRSVLANRLFTGFQHCLRAFKKFTYVYDALQVIYITRTLRFNMNPKLQQYYMKIMLSKLPFSLRDLA